MPCVVGKNNLDFAERLSIFVEDLDDNGLERVRSFVKSSANDLLIKAFRLDGEDFISEDTIRDMTSYRDSLENISQENKKTVSELKELLGYMLTLK